MHPNELKSERENSKIYSSIYIYRERSEIREKKLQNKKKL